MTHEVFSHDPYLYALISRGHLQSPGEVWRYCRHWQYTYHFPIPCNSEDNNHHDVNQHNDIPYGIRQGKDKTTK